MIWGTGRLLGPAFDPDFRENDYVDYTNYTERVSSFDGRIYWLTSMVS